jgi:hypothetical protein
VSIPIPLAVRLKTTRGDRYVTRDLRDLSLRTVVPGGFASCTVSLNRPLSYQPDEVDYYATLYVYDRRNGRTVWEGRVEDLGRGAGADGQVWEIAAVGPSAHARDITRPYIAVDRTFGEFAVSSFNIEVCHWQGATLDDGDPGVECNAPKGAIVPTLVATGDYMYQQVRYAGQKLARVRADWDAGFNNANWLVELKTRTDTGSGTTVASSGVGTAGGTLIGLLTTDGGSMPNGDNVISLRLTNNGPAGAIPDDLVWIQWNNWAARTVMLDKSGSEVTTGYSVSTVKAHEVVADLLGRFLTRYDGPNATIATNTFAIDQLAYYDGVSPEKVLADLIQLEPSYWWAAWESGSSGLNRFEWSAWPSSVGYDADVKDGFDSPGSAVDLYNAVRVRYLATHGKVRTVQVTQTVPALTAAGLTREAFIDVSDQVGSSANATQVGTAFLSEHQYPPNAGRLTIARPVADLTSGRMVQPWEILPGRLIRVRGVKPSVDALNASTRDGVSVFRVTAVDYKASSGTAELELDAPPVTAARLLANRIGHPHSYVRKQWR